MRTVLLLLVLPTVATAADKPIDPVVAAAWGWTAPPVTPTVDTSGVIVGRVTDPTGRHELVERWDGAQWVQEWRAKGGQTVPVRPFGAGLTSHPTTIPTTSATTVERSSTTFRGSTGTAHIRTLAPAVATYGVINGCPPSG